MAKHASDRGVDLPAAALERLARLHGERGTEVIELMTDNTCLRQTLTPDSAVTHGEVVHVIRTEMGVRLRDILMRRLALSDRRPEATFVHACAAVAGSELGWSETRRDAEIADANRGYQIP
jgi:glycerol-3-phosphate dehydrogenase